MTRPAAARRGRQEQTKRADTKIIMDMRKYSGKAFIKLDDVRAHGPLRKL